MLWRAHGPGTLGIFEGITEIAIYIYSPEKKKPFFFQNGVIGGSGVMFAYRPIESRVLTLHWALRL